MTQKKKITSREEILTSGYNNLSIQVSLSGLSFSVVNCTNNTLVLFKKFPLIGEVKTPATLEASLKSALFDSQLSKYRFKKVRLLFKNELSTIVPKPLFDANALKHYLRFSVKLLENDFLTYDEITNTDLVNVYVGHKNIIKYVKNQFDNVSYTHYNSVLIEHAIRTYSTKDGVHLKMILQEREFTLVVVKNKNLQYINSFTYNTKEDLVYYVLFAYEQLGLKPDKHVLEIIGKCTMLDERFKLLYTYIRNVRLVNPLLPFEKDEFYTKEDSIYDITPIEALL